MGTFRFLKSQAGPVYCIGYSGYFTRDFIIQSYLTEEGQLGSLMCLNVLFLWDDKSEEVLPNVGNNITNRMKIIRRKQEYKLVEYSMSIFPCFPYTQFDLSGELLVKRKILIPRL